MKCNFRVECFVLLHQYFPRYVCSGQMAVFFFFFFVSMNVWVRIIVLLTIRFFDVAKFAILTQSSLLSQCRLSFPIVGLKIFSLPYFALKYPNRIFIWYLGKWSKTCSNSPEKLSFELSLFSWLGACSFRTVILYQRPFWTMTSCHYQSLRS